MNKTELITALARKTGKSQAEASRFLDAFTSTLKETLAKGDDLRLIGFGTFDVLQTKERTGRNPQTGSAMQIKPKKKIRFKAGADLSGAVNG